MEDNKISSWMSPKRAAQYIRKQNPNTMIGEHTIRALIKQGFPCVQIGNRYLVNVDSFEIDIQNFSKKIT